MVCVRDSPSYYSHSPVPFLPYELSMIRKDYYKKGRDLLEQRQYDAALKAFNKAARENKKNAPTFRLIIPIIETYIQILEPSRRTQKFLDDSLKIIDVAAESVDEEDTNLVDRWMEIAKELGSRPCYFSKLPIETKTEIFTLVIDVNDAKKFTLSLVCRAWRDIINGSPRFWRNLVLTPKTSQKQADAWLQRSGGTLTSLHITGGFSFSSRPDMLREANPSIWSRLDTLEFTSPSCFCVSCLPPGAVNQLNLIRLDLDTDRLSTGTWQALDKMGKSRLRHLLLDTTSGEIMTTSLFCTSLTSLSLRLRFSIVNNFSFLRGTPMLECLSLTSTSTRYLTAAPIDPLELPHLRYLTLDHFRYTNEFLQHIRFPNITHITIAHARDPLIIPQNLTRLKLLLLSRCILPAADFVTLLRTATSLEHLEIPQCSFRGADENAVIAELARPVPAEEKEGASQIICCPRLQIVDLSGLRRLNADPVILLVTSRLPGVVPLGIELVSPSSSEEPPVTPTRIVNLSLDECPEIDLNALPWLRSVVPYFNHEVIEVELYDTFCSEHGCE